MAASPSDFIKANLTAESFINTSCAIYGKSGSGKSKIIQHILYLLRDHNPTVIVFSMSEKRNNAYSTAMVPRILVHDNVSEEVIQEIAEKQTRKRKIYDRANNIATLDTLFARVATDQQRVARAEIQRAYDEVASKHSIDEVTKNKFTDMLISFFHRVLDPAEARLRRMPDLSENERFAIEWFQFNPRITIVFDDCSTELQKLRTCGDALELIFQGRHGFCTTIIAAHGETFLAPTARSNVTKSFFTDQQVANQFAMRTTNAFSREKRAEISRYANQIHTTVPPTPPYTKMLYENDRPLLVEVPDHQPFSAVSREVRACCDRMTRQDSDKMEPWMKALM